MWTRFFPYSLLTGLVELSLFAHGQAADYDWRSAKPSHHLEFHDCYSEFKCARLLLPLDWTNASDPRTVTIAIAKLPAKVAEDDPSFGGTVFFQPGGPSASGTEYLRRRGPKMRDILDIQDKKHYELLSFDPRGMGNSEPYIDCFPGLLRSMWNLEARTMSDFGSSESALALRIAAAKADGRQCDKVHGSFLSFVGTASVARDMLAILDGLEQQRDHEKDQSRSPKDARLDLRSVGANNIREQPAARLQYIGISYGTQLGNFFASMYPGRVGRMVLDGVVDPNDDVSVIKEVPSAIADFKLQEWVRDMSDTDEILDVFFQSCFEAGCPLRMTDDLSGSDIGSRFWTWTNSLDRNPLIVMSQEGARIFARSVTIRTMVLTALENAVDEFHPLATVLSSAMNGDTSALEAKLLSLFSVQPPEEMCESSQSHGQMTLDAQSAVVCADGEDVSDKSNAYWLDYMQKFKSISSLAGDYWATMRLECAGWPRRLKWSFNGPFATPEPSNPRESPDEDRPAAPLLFVSNRLDPVTPLRTARDVARMHPGSGVLVQESIGHCATLGAMGPCIHSALSRYFDEGYVSQEEVSCQPSRQPWV